MQVISARPAPDSGAVGAAAKYRYAIERLTTLANEFAIAARVSCVEARSPRGGLHEFASRQHADLLQERVEEARRRIPALGGVHADASFGDAVDELRQYGQSVDLLVIGWHKYGPIDRVLEESTSQQLADEPSSPLLVLAAR